jgi:hypothetical protein
MRILTLLLACLLAGPGWAGSIFLTGHDPDFHGDLGGNSAGALHISQAAIAFIQDATFNPFVAAAPRFLFVESNIPAPGGHHPGLDGIVDAGYTEGSDFDHVDASGLTAALNLLGTTYSAIVVASDFGGILTSLELDILNARSADIIAFLNGGGGLYAMAESNGGAGLTTGSTRFGFLPFIVSSTQFNQAETGNTVTPFGASLGLTNADVNGNFSHNIFTSTGGMNIVDTDAAGNILSLAVRSQVTPGGVVPEPSTLVFGSAGLALLLAMHWRKRPRPQR